MLLKPFEPCVPDWQVDADITHRSGSLTLRFLTSGPIAQLKRAPQAPVPERQDELWRSTCYEIFLSRAGREDYWEFNLAPSGHWASYQFSGYRTGQMNSNALTLAAFSSATSEDSMLLTAEVLIEPALEARMPLQLGITAVLEDTSHAIQYYALVHADSRPDFHAKTTHTKLLDWDSP
ncbi:MAG: DOMON-like domain-containing protein [Pseudomonadales bacterium]|nr:DOMON-like domain-containing protein [Pseudomonadales bacterium]